MLEAEDHILYVTGTLSGLDITYLEIEMNKILADVDNYPKKIVLNCSDLDYIDDIGIGFLMVVKRKLIQYNKQLVIKRLNPQPKRMFDLLSLNSVFEISYS